MDIRPMKIDDYDAVYALWLFCRGMGLNNLDDTREGIEKFLERNPDTCFVAVSEGAIIGVIMAGNDGRRGYIYHTAVALQYRNQGVATALVDRTVETLRGLGIIKAALVVFKRNETGNAFWEHRGFHVRTDIVYRDQSLMEIERIDT